jgi:hypothetical protein
MPNKRDGTPQKQNGGRPVSASTEFTRTHAREMAAAGNSPLDVMIKNMLFWDEDAAALAEKLITDFSKIADANQRAKLLKSIEPLLKAREHAFDCALCAVRYVHPRMAAETAQVRSQAADRELEAAYRLAAKRDDPG